MKDLIIRIASTPDLDELARLRLSLQQHLEASNPRIWRITEEGERRLKEELERMFSEEDGKMVVAAAGGELVGFAYGKVFRRSTYSPNNVGQISMVFVQEKFRRRGIGRLLVEELCQFFRAEKVEEVTLRYVLENREAEKFWNDLGFEPRLITANIRFTVLKKHLCAREQITD